MSDRFAEMMSQKVKDIEPPKPLPAGLYYATFTKWDAPREVKTKDGVRHVLDLTFQITQPVEDIDLDGAVLPVTRAMTIWANYDDDGNFTHWDYKLRRALEAMGVDDDDLAVNEALEQAIGSSVVVEVSQRVNPNDPEQVFWDIKSVRPVE